MHLTPHRVGLVAAGLARTTAFYEALVFLTDSGEVEIEIVQEA